MKTFYEYFRKKLLGEIDETKAQQWAEMVKNTLKENAKTNPHSPIVEMPIGH